MLTMAIMTDLQYYGSEPSSSGAPEGTGGVDHDPGGMDHHTGNDHGALSGYYAYDRYYPHLKPESED